MQFTKQPIKIATDPRVGVPNQPVEAFVLGDLAVHRAFNEYPEIKHTWFVVTHVPTGLSLANGKQRRCKALVTELHGLGLRWQFDAHFMTDEIRAMAMPIIRAFNSDMTDCVQNCDNSRFRPATPSDIRNDAGHTLGIAGVWLVGQSRDYFNSFNSDGFTGIEVYNSCGNFVIAVQA